MPNEKLTTKDIYHALVERLDPTKVADPAQLIEIFRVVAEVVAEVLEQVLPQRDEDLGPGTILFPYPDGEEVVVKVTPWRGSPVELEAHTKEQRAKGVTVIPQSLALGRMIVIEVNTRGTWGDDYDDKEEPADV